MAIIFDVELVDGEYRRQEGQHGKDRTVSGGVNAYLYGLRNEGEIVRWDLAKTPEGDPVKLDEALVYVCPLGTGRGARLIAARES